MEFWLPYGETEVPIRVPDDNFYKILEPKKATRPQAEKLVSDSLDNPIGGVSVTDIVKPGSTVAIILDPIVPPPLLETALEQLRIRLEKAQASTKVFFRKRLSNVHLAPKASDSWTPLDPMEGPFREAGQTEHGTKVFVNQELLSSDARICVSMAVPHFASGFAGGPEAVLPGAASFETISKNRSLMIQEIPSPLGLDGQNPVLKDALEACRLVGTLFTVCFIPDGHGGAESAVCGEMESALTEAKSRYLQAHCPNIDRRADIVVVSAGSFLGMDLYHAVRVLSNAWQSVKREGTMILVAECSKGIGDSSFLEYTRKYQEKRELLSELRQRFKLGGHVALLLQESLEKHRVQLVSVLPDHFVKNSFRIRPSRTASHAVQQAIRVEGKEAKILIIPRADLTLPRVGETLTV